MALPQSPPTTSGIVVISGSDFFDPQSSDFPIVRGTVSGTGRKGIEILGVPPVFDAFADLVVGGGQILTSSPRASTVLGRVLRINQDIEIRSTPVTASGIVVMDMFVGAGAVFIVPIVGNVRIFPVFQGVFPEQDRRIFPVLPQFSTLTPGD